MSATDRQPTELSRAMGAVARELLGEPNARLSSKTELRFNGKGSVSVDLVKGTWFDHETDEGGGVLDLLRRRKQMTTGAAMAWLGDRGLIASRRQDQPAETPPPWKRKVEAIYPYRDAEGVLQYEKARFGDGLQPRFSQRRPKAGGGWIWKLDGVTPIPYRLPELLAGISNGEPVYFCEGEKDVAALVALGLIATTTGGTSSWTDTQADWFNGAVSVTILPDHDDTGRKHAAEVAAGLQGHALRVRILGLPGLSHKQDVSDWIAAGGTAEQLEALAASVPAPSAMDLATFLSAEAWAAREFPPPVRLLGDLVTKTSRVFLIGMTGLGKTMLGIAIAAAMATGTDFLGWRCDRPVRVLYVDGEMPGELIKARVIDAMRRLDRPDLAGNLFFYSADYAEQTAAAYPGLGEMQPLNTEAGQDFILKLLEKIGGIDVIVFDNVMSLIAGDQKEEVPWSETLPLISGLTRRQIGQVWLDHTGHNTARQYGSSTKAWRFDAVGIMTELPEDQRNERETAFKLSFDAPGKARRRTPANWTDFSARIVRLTDQGWQSDAPCSNAETGPGHVAPSRKAFYPALLSAITRSTEGPGRATLAGWQDQSVLMGLLDAPSERESGASRDKRIKPWANARRDLVAARYIKVDAETGIVIDLLNRYG